MEEKPLSFSSLLLLFHFLTIFVSFACSSSDALQYQNFVVTPLSKTSSLSSSIDEEQIPISASVPRPHSKVLYVDLHHVDSLSNNLTQEALLERRLCRDAVRASRIVAQATAVAFETGVRNAVGNPRCEGFSGSVVSGLPYGSGEYFTRFGIGTPTKYFYMVLDTGSDLTWMQCSPCRICYNQSDPIFDPSQSASFHSIGCRSQPCPLSYDFVQCGSRKVCIYHVPYGDGSFTNGELSTETLTFRETSFPNVTFGCGHVNVGLFAGSAGILGLGRGNLSFPSQIAPRFDMKFSYCLVHPFADSSNGSSIIFGDAAVSRKAIFTTMITNPRIPTYYYLVLNGISVGGVRVPNITKSLFKLDAAGNGGVIIDSGTSVTRLYKPAYTALRNAFRKRASNLKITSAFSLLDTCFDLAGKTEVKVPTVVLHFNKADVSLPASNYLIPVDSKGKFCFAFADSKSGLSIIGNIQQQGFRVVFDLDGSRIGFVPQSCT